MGQIVSTAYQERVAFSLCVFFLNHYIELCFQHYIVKILKQFV